MTGFIEYRREVTCCEPTVADLTTENVYEYLKKRAEQRGWQEQTLKTYGGEISAVAGALREMGFLAHDTMFGYRAPQVTEKAPIYFEDEDLAAIFDHLEGDRTEVSLRLRATAQVMLDCGARPAEIAKVRFRDLDEAHSRIHFHGKGAKDRRAPVSVQHGSSWPTTECATGTDLDERLRVRQRSNLQEDASAGFAEHAVQRLPRRSHRRRPRGAI